MSITIRKEKTDKYYRSWEKAENSNIERGKYLGLFLHSDAMIHDCGKPIVAEKINGETHYYSHHNVGSYESMFFDYSEYPSVDPVYVGFLVNHHMDCFFWKDNPQKGKVKFAKRFGYNN